MPRARAAIFSCSSDSVMPVTLDARCLGQIERHAAPAGADVEHVRTRLEQELCRDVPLLGQLRLVEAVPGVSK